MTKSRSETPHIPVSWGELIDKVTILEIKRERLAREAAIANVEKELFLLTVHAAEMTSANPTLRTLMDKLRSTNEALWDTEELIRDKERKEEFDSAFIQLARAVYKRNDERASIKRQINELLNSELVEEKSYS